MITTILPGPAGPSERPPKPGLLPFLRGRVMGPNGVAAALYLLLSLWIWRNPRRAARLWRRLQGRK